MNERQKSILVVDDDRTVVEFLSESLAERGFDVTGAVSGQEALDHMARRPFDLVAGPLLRLALLCLVDEPGEHVLLLTQHHIVSDGWSMGVLARELGALYAAFRERRPSPLPEPAWQYADFAVWQREWLAGGELAAQLGYWRSQLGGQPRGLIGVAVDELEIVEGRESAGSGDSEKKAAAEKP